MEGKAALYGSAEGKGLRKVAAMTANVFASGAARDQLLLHTDAGADRGTACPHLEVLPGRAKVQSGSAASPRSQVERIPSTDWEETFPWNCFSRRNVTTTLMRLHLNKQALCGPHRRRQSCRFGPLSLFVVGCLDNKNVVYFFYASL